MMGCGNAYMVIKMALSLASKILFRLVEPSSRATKRSAAIQVCDVPSLAFILRKYILDCFVTVGSSQ